MPTRCHCGTEISPDILACPMCGALAHSDRLKQLAAEAEAIHVDSPRAARDLWVEALALLPAHSQQHAVIRGRVADLTRTIEGGPDGPRPQPSGSQPWWWRGAAGAGTIALLLATKLKFLLLGLTKASTFLSMFAFFGVYWSIYGWPLALGLVVAIYVHEMGHVWMLRQCGIAAGAPMFIPGVGAFVMLKEHVSDPLTDAKIGLAGPVWGLGAALTALAVYIVSRAPIWFAIAQLTAFLNLFNLIPVWQLDGSRGMHVLARWERWTLVGVIVLALLVTEQRLLFIVGAVAVWRALQKDTGPGDARVLMTFAGLIASLSWLARHVG